MYSSLHPIIRTLLATLVVCSLLCTSSVSARKLSRNALDRQERAFQAVVNGRASTTVRQQVLNRGLKAIRNVVRNPHNVSSADSNAIGLLSPAQRAQALTRTAGFKIKKVDFAKSRGSGRVTKQRLLVKRDQRTLGILAKVMGPGTLGFLPAKSHSYAMWYNQVVDLYFSDMKDLRPGAKPIFPIWLSPKESSRLGELYMASMSKGFSSVYGTSIAYGKPAAWPLQTLKQKSTANSCTTAFTRSAVGPRKTEFSWIDRLEATIAGNPTTKKLAGDTSLLESLNGKTTAQIDRTFKTLSRALPDQKTRLKELSTWVANHRRLLPCFPLQLMHRTSVGELAGIFGDNPGPGKTRQAIRGSSSNRIPVEIKFED